MNSLYKYSVSSVLVLGLLFVTGCSEGGPDRGQVSGKITWKGEPVVDATVSFLPVEGRASVGTTDQDGAYKLAYSKGKTGALLGEHTITISHDPNDPSIAPAVPLPAQFSIRTTTPLKRTVEAGSNTIDIELNDAK